MAMVLVQGGEHRIGEEGHGGKRDQQHDDNALVFPLCPALEVGRLHPRDQHSDQQQKDRIKDVAAGNQGRGEPHLVRHQHGNAAAEQRAVEPAMLGELGNQFSHASFRVKSDGRDCPGKCLKMAQNPPPRNAPFNTS
jgi:hypothetical protein